MPPPEAGDPLSPEEAAIIERWIAAGAPWSGHWAFEPVVRVEPPAVRDESWVESPIDRFILARLEAEGIAPSPRADRATLIRRLYIDLLGLPPAPEDVDEFVHDDRPFAWERLVDRLLGDPHYGERQARHWLDAARYADSHGYSIDGPRT
ncbi:MAG TPA: DUF1549 domain-containing protein, partial [Planctomycetota bacterium]|nr:DUF1549 domain-containing protein [Planctomycetota bacterium]